MSPRLRTVPTLSLALAFLAGPGALAGPTHVGNGDDGRDLEGGKKVTSGKLIDARTKALQALDRTGTSAITGLGDLRAELEKSDYYLAATDVRAGLESDQGAFHASMTGQVYARTFARPHAETRFFPIALGLAEPQLIALEIHEALHRALPASVRENEMIVSELTLAITSPESSRDSVSEVAARWIPAQDARDRILSSAASPEPAGAALPQTQAESPIPDDAEVKRPSLLGYTYYRFRMGGNGDTGSEFPILGMHVIQSQLYPFGGERSPFGIGIEASLIERPTTSSAGPLGLSAHLKVLSGRDYDIALTGQLALNTLSSDELKNSPFGRDLGTIGVRLRKTLPALYVENDLSYTGGGQATQKVGRIDINHDYGSVVSAVVHAGAPIWKLRVGAFADVFLADYYRMSEAGQAVIDTGRFRVISGGPEVSLEWGSLIASVHGRFILNTSDDSLSFDYLGNLLVSGVQQGNIGATVGYRF